MSQMIIVEAIDRNRFTRNDIRRFERQARADARIMAHIIAGPSQDVTEEDLCNCIGIEKILSHHTERRIVLHRKKHVQGILSSQHTLTAEGLARFSQDSSFTSTEIAQTLAKTYKAGQYDDSTEAH